MAAVLRRHVVGGMYPLAQGPGRGSGIERVPWATGLDLLQPETFSDIVL